VRASKKRRATGAAGIARGDRLAMQSNSNSKSKKAKGKRQK
jgi:hypothetical protein